MTFQEIIKEIQNARKPSGFPIKLIAIDGRAGSGKSTLTKKLSEKFNAEMIKTDDFASWDNQFDWWLSFIKDVIEPIKNGASSLSYQRSSWGSDHKPEPIKDQPITPAMILDGVGSARKEFRPFLTYVIWVEASKSNLFAEGFRTGWAKKAQAVAKVAGI